MSKLSNHIGASFITLIAKKSGAESIKDLRLTSLIGSIYKVLAKLLASRLQKVLPNFYWPLKELLCMVFKFWMGC